MTAGTKGIGDAGGPLPPKQKFPKISALPRFGAEEYFYFALDDNDDDDDTFIKVSKL